MPGAAQEANPGIEIRNTSESFPHRYAILRDPGHNRVFYNESLGPAMAEMSLCCDSLNSPCSIPRSMDIAGVSYLVFNSRDELGEMDIRKISCLSSFFALFKITGSGKEQEQLIPVPRSSIHYLHPAISSLQKYKGKTNELFTRMMLNTALMAAGINPAPRIRILDPVAGRGTTLFESMILGLDAFGIEQDRNAVQESSVFLRQYLQTGRLKHKQNKRQVGGSGKNNAVFSVEFEYARSKEEFMDPESRRIAAFIHGDAREAHRYFRKNFFHLIVGDLPYGISHGSKNVDQGSAKLKPGSAKQRGSLTRNPLELLEACLPSWIRVLKPGGAIALAWNTNVLSVNRVREALSAHGFSLPEGEAFNRFGHQVDRAIRRDIVVGLKPEN